MHEGSPTCEVDQHDHVAQHCLRAGGIRGGVERVEQRLLYAAARRVQHGPGVLRVAGGVPDVAAGSAASHLPLS